MTGTDDVNSYLQGTRPGIIRSYLYTSLFCVAIALMLHLTGMVGPLASSLITSFSIGLSVNTAFVLAPHELYTRMGPYLGPVVACVIGLGVGLLLAGTLVAGKPLLYFTVFPSGLVLGVFFAAAGFFLVSARMNLLDARLSLAQARATAADQERRRLETELRLLQAQMEPHFLFNTLSNVVSLVGTEPEAAERTLHNLTRLLRASLERTRDGATTLAEELEIVRAHLEIAAVRMGDRLDYSFEIEDGLMSVSLPPLLLQPLVENALRHGLEPRESGGRITVSARRDGDCLELVVSDDGRGLEATAPTSGVGLRNVRERLRGLYGKRAGLQLATNEPRGVTATLRLPLDGERE